MKQTIVKSLWTGKSILLLEQAAELSPLDMHGAMSATELELRALLLQRQVDRQFEALEKLLSETRDLLLVLRRKRDSEETEATKTAHTNAVA